MDFFSSQHGSQPSSSVNPTADPFAQEIGRRFALPAGQPMLTARLSPVATTTTSTVLATPQAKLGNLSLKSTPSSPVPVPLPSQSSSSLDARITAIVPTTILGVLNTPGVLVLDIRPNATFSHSRLPHALSLSVPSTLLKRPAFSLAKLTEMLPSSSGRRHFASWKTASRIIVYDADSNAIPEGSNIRGLLRKFDNEGFRGDLAWLKGGFAGVWRECRALVDDGPPSPASSEEGDSEVGYLRAKNLPSSAFQQVSTTTATQRPSSRPAPIHNHTVAPGPTSTRPLAANPFYDNIRQNRELEHGITEHIPLRLPASVIARRDDLPFDWLKEIVDKADAEEGTEALAMQFYMIELREQRRLMGIMDHHSHESASSQHRVTFPYSITAGVEKGSKNRYTNIWPFEHARVRLNTRNSDGCDYINASYVQPLGTDRRYIATQGPLPTTYTDFWTLCWEQNIRIIVMLTKEVEGAVVKCGSYWKETSYGPLRLRHVSSSGAEEERPAPAASGFDFGVPSSAPLDSSNATVRRTFLLSHTGHPEQPPRKISQLQYLAWPDFDVPDNPRGLLDLMREVDVLRGETEADSDAGPVLLHCSAGIGRTGGFIIVDAALRGIRREIKKRRASKRQEADLDVLALRSQEKLEARHEPVFTASPAPMDVDTRESSPVHRHRLRGFPMRQPPNDSSGTESGVHSDDSRARSLSPALSVPGSSSTGPVLRPSALASDVDLRPQAKRSLPKIPKGPIFAPEPEPAFTAGALTRFRLAQTRAGESSSSVSTNMPSLFSMNISTDKSTPTGPSSVSVESSRSPSPHKDAKLPQAAFDYTEPRQLHDNASPELLSSYVEPVRKMLEDMREQRMSLCQSLRQYVFVHRAIVEGALDIVDEERGAPSQVKRGPSPTELLKEDRKGGVSLSKRPSFKRRDRSDMTVEQGLAVR